MTKEPSQKARAAQLDRQLANWAANEKQNKAEKTEFARQRADGRLPSAVDRFDVQKYQRSVTAFNSKKKT